MINESIAIALAALMGVAAGIWMRRGHESKGMSETLLPDAESLIARGEHLLNQADALLLRLRELTADVQAEVVDHGSVVAEIDRELRQSEHDGNRTTMLTAFQQLISANEQLQNHLRAADLKLQRQSERIDGHLADARTDSLTGLANRRRFDDDLRQCLVEAAEHGRPVSLMLLDVDWFKSINDRFGYDGGDQVLKHVAKVLCRRLAERESVYRFGGEEFAVIFSGTPLDAARAAAERLRDAIGDAPINIDGQDLCVTVSAGLAMAAQGDQVRDIVHRAGIALHASKESGRDCGHWTNGNHFIPLSADPSTAEAHSTSQAGSAGDPPASSFRRPLRTVALNPNSAGPDGQLQPQSGHQLLDTLSTSDVFYADVARRLAAWRRGGEPLALLLIQLDQFQALQQQGPDAPLVALECVARMLTMDLREMDHVGRVQPTILGVILTNVDQNSAILVAERIRRRVSQLLAIGARSPIELSVSIGLIESTKACDSADELIMQAHATLEEAIRRGGNRTFLHDGKKPEQVFVAIPDLDSPGPKDADSRTSVEYSAAK